VEFPALLVPQETLINVHGSVHLAFRICALQLGPPMMNTSGMTPSMAPDDVI